MTTRVPCVGNGVPWLRADVGAVATQANTRTEYGNEPLDLLAKGLTVNINVCEHPEPVAELRRI